MAIELYEMQIKINNALLRLAQLGKSLKNEKKRRK